MEKEIGTLFVIATPIGNLSDISLRALEVLKKIDRLLAEDTRNTAFLLQKFEVKVPYLDSYHAHNEHQKAGYYIDKIKNGENIGLVSDAGTPAISDPGYLIVKEALENNISIEIIPGPVAFIPALIKSGFALHRFSYEGFLPQKKGRQTRIKEIVSQNQTTVLYESPYRILKLLEQLKLAGFNHRKVSISRELTKKFEQTITGEIDELIQHFTTHTPKGEFVVVLQGLENAELA